MKRKRYICETCGVRDEQTHIHHILPRSRGGTDLPSNLIEVCPPCHKNIHNTSFNGDAGLIKSGLKNTKLEEKEAKMFMERNIESVMIFCEDFCGEYGTEILHEMMRFDILSAVDFVRIIKRKRMKKSFGQIPSMICQLYEQSPQKYNFIFSEIATQT